MATRAIASLALCVLALAFVLPSGAAAQDGVEASRESAVVAPGPDYAASGFHRFWWGNHYRDTWTTEVRVPILDLGRYAGGLEPLSAGGGLQTRSLWFRGADGKVHAFRSIYKYATELVPEVLRGTYVEQLFQDQMSSQYPYAPVVASPLMRAAAVLHSEPRVYLLPDSAALGRFGAVFGNLLGTLQVRPVGPEGAIAIPGAEEIVDGFEVVERLQSDPSRRLDARAYLRARLIDVLIGDWDRHADQWLWARFPEDEPASWRPIPTDRDQAFARLDGLVLSIARRRLPMLTSFRDEYDDASRYHYQARFIDRLALTGLERAVWDSMARQLRAAVTDAVIEDALASVPDAARPVGGPFLRSGLRSRRDALPRIAADFYELMAREPYVHGTDVAEVAEITGTGDGVEITLRSAEPGSTPYFRRVFRSGETREVRLYLHGGDDRAAIDGDGDLPVKVRIIGGPGDDEFHFVARVGNVHLYDEQGADRVTGADHGINEKRYAENRLVPEPNTPAPPRHWGSFSYPFFTAGFDPDVGFVLGGTYSWFDYGFRKDPYASRIDLSAAGSTRLKYSLGLETEFRFENSPLFTRFAATGTSFQTINFYGVGNDTQAIQDTTSDFYDVENTRVRGTASLGIDLGPGARFLLSASGSFSNTEDDPATFLGQSPGIYGTGEFGQVGAGASLELETVTPDPLVVSAARTVAWLRVRGELYPEAIDVRETYGSLAAVGAVSLPLGIRRWEVGLRAGGKKVWGDTPFFDLAFIGGDESLRGWPEQRFAGDASLYGSAELRFDLFHYRFVFPSTFGLLALVDAGRVWIDGDSAGDWHTGYGGGFWIALRGTRSILSVAYAESKEDSGLYINLGYPF
ncbi:MAG: hypothetical protein GWN99_14085 [Gemmatimonadetes bacterium]|uniref:Bacterial surface antigen (D15) domain-containing protein n=1 Tax=Candidatus Kutchimonas denitrificans TaxID=3056748 RepID=A0AAE4Z980_9BACT|nr:hypothetical protein [Gemmatimonadota bacterium]NIR75983.1 hypothetical protein [Candidatus Kutchimonas denitrificans]NIS02175.1 hypothetical protein [Gemmatimonadota bacterium]NIT68001.1 hypothetical protein [Gemmatimonadota bacterium]NIU54027.1 hypothetical protein [Gemmatimonadota bacterium]